MGFFDIIEQLTTTPQDWTEPEQAKTMDRAASALVVADYHQEQPADTGKKDLRRPAVANLAERKRIVTRKPERLSFLQPCPLCGGRAFLHSIAGGFFCQTCQPVFQGELVEATGPDRPNQLSDPDLHRANNNEATGDRQPNTGQQRAHFAAAWPWIKENMERLLAAGWTRAALVRRAKFRWPYGPWGVAWLSVWSKVGVMVTMGRRGEIVFTYPSGGRTITQVAHQPTRSLSLTSAAPLAQNDESLSCSPTVAQKS